MTERTVQVALPEELTMVLSTVTEFQLLIGGEWVASSSGQSDGRAQPGDRQGRGPRRQGHR